MILRRYVVSKAFLAGHVLEPQDLLQGDSWWPLNKEMTEWTQIYLWELNRGIVLVERMRQHRTKALSERYMLCVVHMLVATAHAQVGSC